MIANYDKKPFLGLFEYGEYYIDWKNTKKMTNLNNLPEEVLYMVFTHLSDHHILWNVGFTCLRLQNAAINFLKKINLQIYPTSISDNFKKVASGVESDVNLLNRSKQRGQDVARILSNKKFTSRIIYLAIGNIDGSFYQKQVVEEVEENKAQYCSKLVNDISSKVL